MKNSILISDQSRQYPYKAYFTQTFSYNKQTKNILQHKSNKMENVPTGTNVIQILICDPECTCKHCK